MIEQRIPEIGEVWTEREKVGRTGRYVTVKAIDDGVVWVRTSGGAYHSFYLWELHQRYNPPKKPLLPLNYAFPSWYVVIGTSLGGGYSSEEVARTHERPIIRIDGVDENGKLLGEQVR